MTDRLVFSLRCNNDLSVREFVEIAVAADDAGFDQVWVSDDLFYNSATVMLSAAAAATRRIRLGTGILNPYTIHPAEMAMFARSLDELSTGRAMLGLAAGAEDFLSWAGVERSRPMSTMRSAMSALRYLLEAPGTIERPPGWTEDAFMRVGGGSARTVPIYLGAMSPQMLALAGELADGALPLLFPPERYGEARAAVLAGADGVGRVADDVDIAACVWCSVAADRAEAVRPLALKIAYYGPSFSPHVLHGLGLEPADLMPAREAFVRGDDEEAVRRLPSAALRLGVAGDAGDVAERVAGLVESGATHISFGPPLGPEPIDAVRVLEHEVIAALRH